MSGICCGGHDVTGRSSAIAALSSQDLVVHESSTRLRNTPNFRIFQVDQDYQIVKKARLSLRN